MTTTAQSVAWQRKGRSRSALVRRTNLLDFRLDLVETIERRKDVWHARMAFEFDNRCSGHGECCGRCHGALVHDSEPFPTCEAAISWCDAQRIHIVARFEVSRPRASRRERGTGSDKDSQSDRPARARRATRPEWPGDEERDR